MKPDGLTLGNVDHCEPIISEGHFLKLPNENRDPNKRNLGNEPTVAQQFTIHPDNYLKPIAFPSKTKEHPKI
jgi:hypothetical protein